MPTFNHSDDDTGGIGAGTTIIGPLITYDTTTAINPTAYI